jgi:CheY-like chemotaxis protein
MTPKRILIAEDQMETREELIKLATKRGYDVASVTNGVDLLKIATDKKFDLVITDLLMPGLNGASAAEIMNLQGDTTPVILLTGLAQEDLNLGQDKFTRIFHKPVNAGELFEYIESLLGEQV